MLKVVYFKRMVRGLFILLFYIFLDKRNFIKTFFWTTEILSKRFFGDRKFHSLEINIQTNKKTSNKKKDFLKRANAN